MSKYRELIEEAEAAAKQEARALTLLDQKSYVIGWLAARLARTEAEKESLQRDLKDLQAADNLYRLDHIESQLDERDRARDMNAALR